MRLMTLILLLMPSAEWQVAVRQDAGQVRFQAAGKVAQRLEAAAHGSSFPECPGFASPSLTAVAPSPLP